MAKKKPVQNKGKIRESEQENEAKQTENEDEGADDGQHDDAAQDVALIKKMIGEYVGDGAKKLSKEDSEGLHKLGKEAYQAHKEMGKKEDEAYKCAGEAVKLAHHMASKQNEDESENETESEDEGNLPPPKKKAAPKAKGDGKDGDNDGDADDDDGNASEAEGENESETETESENESENETESEGKKESKVIKRLKNQLLEAEGRIAALEAKERKLELDKYIEAELKKSGQPVAVTKRFREAAGKVKSKVDFDGKWKLFLEGVKGRRSETTIAEDDFSGVLMERATTTEDGERTASEDQGSDSFSECAD